MGCTKVAFTMKLKQDRVQDYIKIHEDIWPEMKIALKNAGRFNFSIWLSGNTVFGYYEIKDKLLNEVLKQNEVFKRWNKEIKDMLDMENDIQNSNIKEMKMIFYLD